MAPKRKKVFEASTEVRAIARERVGRVKPGQTILPKDQRKPKHKSDLLRDPAATDQ
jgi:hypothetical protein